MRVITMETTSSFTRHISLKQVFLQILQILEEVEKNVYFGSISPLTAQKCKTGKYGLQ